jgi:hypothetical protein
MKRKIWYILSKFIYQLKLERAARWLPGAITFAAINE